MSAVSKPLDIQVKMNHLDLLTHEERAQEENTRNQMIAYWTKHTGDNPSESTMMLMTKDGAATISGAEQKEIFEKLGDIEGSTVLELGAGMGRYTALFAEKKLKELHAVDFMEASIKKNETLHGHIPGFTFEQADVTKLNVDKQYDVVFSNWLMMYLTDKEVDALAENMLKWCKPGGIIFFRESCAGGPSGDKPREGFNPTNYRQAEHYTTVFDGVPGAKRISHEQVKCYVEIKKKTNQYAWKYRKEEAAE